MIIRKDDMTMDIRHQLRGGQCDIDITNLVPKEALHPKVRLFGKMLIEPGCSIGAHTHDTETEFYYILSGEGVFDDNGKISTVYAGDNTATGGGAYHALANKTDRPLEVLAVIVLD